jgi:hypothetical protein
MSIGSTLTHALGIVLSILIPGTSTKDADLTHVVQQDLAKLYGVAARDMAQELKLDTTGMSGPDKVFAITKAIVETHVAAGFKGDVQILEAVALDVAQTAYRASLSNFGAAIVALAAGFSTNPIVAVAASLIGSEAQKAADAELARLAQPAV